MKWNDYSPYQAEYPYSDNNPAEVGPNDPGGRWDDPIAGDPDTGPCPPDKPHMYEGACQKCPAGQWNHNNVCEPIGSTNNQNQNQNNTPKPSGPTPPYNPGYKFAPVPQFTGLEDFKGPSFEEAMNDPGYKFAVDEGRRARDASAAARGTLRTGAQARSLDAYGQAMGAQQYQNVYGRRWNEYGQRYRQALDQYSPRLAEWTLGANAEIGGKNIANQNMWNEWRFNNLSASDLWQALYGA